MGGADESVKLINAMTNVMLQSIFVQVEHMRIYGQVLNDAITDDEGQELLDRTKEFAETGEGLVAEVLDELEGGDHDETVRFLKRYIEEREDFEGKVEQAEEQITERADDAKMFY